MLRFHPPHALLALACSLLPATGRGANLIRNGDFESGRGNPPDGWAMWGAAEYKKPANYGIDTAVAHGGRASFRIHHPRDTAGYVITDPRASAIRPERGASYAISFWARSDSESPAGLRVASYRSLSPLVEGAGIDSYPLAVGPEWRRFSFTLVEGRDFLADACPHIYLAFAATWTRAEAKTLWIDDLTVAKGPGIGAARPEFVDDSRLPYNPPPLRLEPGSALRLRVDAARRLHRSNRLLGGIAFHRVSGFTGLPYSREGEYSLTPALEESIRDLRLPLTRFYAVGDEVYPLEDSIDRVARVLDRLGIPQEPSVLEFEDQGANRKLAPERWAQGVRHSLAKGYRFRRWEIGNETYSVTFNTGRPHGGAFPTPDDYIAHFLRVSAAIREVQPDAQIGLSIHQGNHRWGNYVMGKTAGHYDFVVPHWYGGIVADDFEETVLAGNHQKLCRMLQLDALLKVYNPGRTVCQYDTEWGLHAPGAAGKRADDNPRNANIVGALFRAVRLLYTLREDALAASISWQLLSRARSPGFGILFAPPDDRARSMLYWVHHQFNRHAGDWVIDLSGTAPYHTSTAVKLPGQTAPSFSVPLTPAVATLDADGATLHLMLVNGSWDEAYPCEVALANFAVRDAGGVILSHADRDAHPLLERAEDFMTPLRISAGPARVTFELPPHSVAFVSLRR